MSAEYVSNKQPSRVLSNVANELKENNNDLRSFLLSIRMFIIEHAIGLGKANQRRARSIVESRFTPAQEAFESGMLSCGAMTNIAASMLRSVNYQVKLIHGETRDSVDHAWISVREPSTGEWQEYDLTRPQIDIPNTHIKKFEVDSWDEIADQIRSDCETLLQRRRARAAASRTRSTRDLANVPVPSPTSQTEHQGQEHTDKPTGNVREG